MDGNAKLGNGIIKDDPNVMSENGKILWSIVERRDCIVVNATNKCHGIITRSRLRNDRKEESILDYVVINQKVAPFLQGMYIDESKEKVLTRYKKKTKVMSDHNVITCTMNIPHIRPPLKRVEVYSLRNEEDLTKFKEATSRTTKFTECFDGDGSVREQGKEWMKRLKSTIHQCFRKIRITKKTGKRSITQMIIDERKRLRRNLVNAKTSEEKHQLQDEIQIIEEKISEECSKQHMDLIRQHVSDATDENGNMNTGKVWKLRKKLCPKPSEQLSAKKDKEGNRITEPSQLQR